MWVVRSEENENGEVTVEKGRGRLRKKFDFCPEGQHSHRRSLGRNTAPIRVQGGVSPETEMLHRNRKQWWHVTERDAGGREEIRSEAC